MNERKTVQLFFQRLKETADNSISSNLPVQLLHSNDITPPIERSQMTRQILDFSCNSFLVGPPPGCAGQTF